jgi:hypothetical protein
VQHEREGGTGRGDEPEDEHEHARTRRHDPAQGPSRTFLPQPSFARHQPPSAPAGAVPDRMTCIGWRTAIRRTRKWETRTRAEVSMSNRVLLHVLWEVSSITLRFSAREAWVEAQLPYEFRKTRSRD